MAKKKQNLKAPDKLKGLFIIVDRKKTDFYIDYIQGFESNLQTVLYAKGTAPSEVAHMLGLEDSSKSVLFCVIKESKEPDIMDGLNKKFTTVKNGQGIAFTISLTSVIGVMMYKFLSNTKEA